MGRPTFTIEDIKASEEMSYIYAHPGCTRSDVAKGLQGRRSSSAVFKTVRRAIGLGVVSQRPRLTGNSGPVPQSLYPW
jgi:hypothetical protein